MMLMRRIAAQSSATANSANFRCDAGEQFGWQNGHEAGGGEMLNSTPNPLQMRHFLSSAHGFGITSANRFSPPPNLQSYPPAEPRLF